MPATPGHLRLAAELAFGADLARHAGHLRGEAVQLVDHRVDGVLELEDLALHVDRDLLGQVARGDRGGHLGDVADLAGQVVGHQVDVVGQVLPGPADARHLRLAAELAFGADLARHAGHLGGEGVELVDHRVDGVLELEDLALHVDGDLLGQVARATAVVTSAMLRTWPVRFVGHQVDVVGQVLPGAGDAWHLRLAAERIVMTQVLCELLDVDTVVERHAGEMVAQGMHAGLAVRDVVATTAVVPSRWLDDADRR